MSTANDILQRVDENTGELVTYRTADTWEDGTPMTNAKCDGIIYRKKGSYFYKLQYQFLDIRWFGAVGDGSTDNSDAIQKAVDFVNKGGDGWRNGIASGKIYFPSGIYNISKPIQLYNGSYIEGESKGSVFINNINKDVNTFVFVENQTSVNNSITLKRFTIKHQSKGSGIALDLSVTADVAGALTPTLEDIVTVSAGVGFKLRVNIQPSLRGCYAIGCGIGYDFGDVFANGSFNFGVVATSCYATSCDIGWYGYLEMSTFFGCSGDSCRIGFDMGLVGCTMNIGAEGNSESCIRLKKSNRSALTVNVVAVGGNGLELLEGSSNNEILGQIYATTNVGVGVRSTGFDNGSYIKPATGNIIKAEVSGFANDFDDVKKYSIIENGREILEKGFRQVLWFSLADIVAGATAHATTTMNNILGYKIGGGRLVGMIINKENNTNVPAVGSLSFEAILYQNDEDIPYMAHVPNSSAFTFNTLTDITKRYYVANPDLCVFAPNDGVALRVTASADYESQYMKTIKVGVIVEL